MKIVFVGGGNMAAALIGGMLQQGFATADLHVVDVSAQARSRMELLGVNASEEWDPHFRADVVVFAVKPQLLKQVASDVRRHCAAALIISIAAGIRAADLSRWLDGHGRIVRVMPNTPALIQAGISGLYATGNVSDQDRQWAHRILSAAGKCLWFEREADLDVVTAVSGSGPAYVFYFIEALEQAAIELGLGMEAARTLAIATFGGAARLAESGVDAPAVLRAKVTSKGGTTEAALLSLEQAGVKQHIVEAVKRAQLRAHELGDEFGHE